MQTLWQKLWFYTRLVLISAGALAVLLFVIFNFRAKVMPEVNLIFWKYQEPGLLLVLLLTAFFSITGWWLFWTIFRTIRQITSARDRARLDRMQREMDEIKLKAARLQTKAAASTPSTEIDSPPPTA